MLIHFFIVLIIYSLYVQFSPTMGNIWLRTNAENEQEFCPMSLIELICSPFYRPYFWHYSLLPINFWVYLLVYLVIYYNLIEPNFISDLKD